MQSRGNSGLGDPPGCPKIIPKCLPFAMGSDFYGETAAHSPEP